MGLVRFPHQLLTTYVNLQLKVTNHKSYFTALEILAILNIIASDSHAIILNILAPKKFL